MNEGSEPEGKAHLERKCDAGRVCPTIDAHRRLRAAHRLWHQAQSSYSDPDGFCTNLNACIQALRSVTWVLQKGKRQIPEFDDWYGRWQERLRADSIMRWLVNARNRIEKQGDLETRSKVRAKLLASYDAPPTAEFDVPPLVPTAAIADSLAARGVPPELREEGILVVERRWIADDLPDRELLDALAHAYGVLSDLIDDAHVQAGAPPTRVYAQDADGALRPILIPNDQLQGRLPCMIDSESHRTVYVNLRTRELGVLRKTAYAPRPDKLDRQELRSKFPYREPPDWKGQPPSLAQEAEWLFETAKDVLRTDGYHSLMVFLRLPTGGRKLLQLAPADRAEKFLHWDEVAREVEKTGADSVIVISESWFAPFDAEYPDRPAAESPERKEVLAVDAESADGEKFTLMAEFYRQAGEIKFKEAAPVTYAPGGYLEPIRRVWKKRPQSKK